MKRLLLIFILVFLFINVGSVKLLPERLASINQVDISLVDSSLTQLHQGVYEFTATIQNTGDSATTGTVPISWEEYVYALPLTNGIGTLDEIVADYDINGDGDEGDTFAVEWNNTIRPWDAEIDGAYVYALADHSVDRGFNRSYYIDGKSKLFQLGNKMHTLYYADNDVASFGLGDAVILNHPSPNFELVVYSDVSFTDIKINGVNTEVIRSVTGVETFADGTEHTYSICVVPNQAAIGTNEQIKFSCMLIAHESITCEVALLTNWSPDGKIRYRWVPFDQVDVSFEAINRPYFISVDSAITQVDTGMKRLNATIKNIGTPATTVAKVPVIWEKLYYEFSLDNGEGTLDESIIDYDINGDGDKDDAFDVRHDASANRPLDAVVDGVHVYSILDQPHSPWYNFTFYIDGKSKLFKLGSETHAFYMADNEIAAFGLGAVLRNHPSPSFRLAYESQNIDASDFKINGEAVEVDYEERFVHDVYYEENRRTFTVCIVPDQASKISSNEIITFSCTFTAHKNVTSEIVLRMDWSPDSNIRYRSGVLFWQADVEFEVTASIGTPGFSFIFSLLIVFPVLIYIRKRKKT